MTMTPSHPHNEQL